MKRYFILACFLASNMMFGMEQPSILPAKEENNQQQLIAAIENCASAQRIDKLVLRKLLNEANINYQYPGFRNATPLMRAILGEILRQ